MVARWTMLVLVAVVTVDASSRLERDLFSCSIGESCTPLSSCAAFQILLQRPTPAVLRRVRKAGCNRDRRDPKVCCPGTVGITFPITPTRPITPPTRPITPPKPNPGNGGTSRCGPGETCIPLRSCSAFQDVLGDPAAQMRRVRQAVCNRDRRDIKVCCPTSGAIIIPTPTPPVSPITPTSPTQSPVIGELLLPAKCRPGGGSSRKPGTFGPLLRERRRTFGNLGGELKEKRKPGTVGILVTSGIDANLGDSPWIAALGYGSLPFWGCGGTLITDQYVLTAAHCVHPTYTRGATLTVVRLGELNLEAEPDCERGQCAPSPQDFTPAEITIHPDFDTRATVSDDIALIRLNRKTSKSNYVEPLCLPPAGVDVEVLLGGRQAEVSGWGLTELERTSDILQKANLPFVNKNICNPHFDNELLPEQVCFGGGAQDSCRGDSGGPLVVRGSSPRLVGIVSRGKDSRCGVLGNPAVYTHVAAYRSWITQNLRP